MSQSEGFPCYRCGACCRHVSLSTETRFLDRGDGICRHFDSGQNVCSIYESRPEICRVDRQYHMNYKSVYTWNEFVVINLKACQVIESLDEEFGRPHSL